MLATQDRNLEHVRSIAEKLENPPLWDYTNGCEVDESYQLNSDEGLYYLDGECVDVYEMSAMEFLSDVLDIEYRVSANGEYRSARIMVACGGPNIYIDTGSKTVELFWWSEAASCRFADDIGLDDAVEELWNCR